MRAWERTCSCGQSYVPQTIADGHCPTCRYQNEPSYRQAYDDRQYDLKTDYQDEHDLHPEREPKEDTET